MINENMVLKPLCYSFETFVLLITELDSFLIHFRTLLKTNNYKIIELP